MDDRFARHTLIEGWNSKALLDSTVIIAGIGAIGNEVSRLLALAGVERLIICDPDIIETSNLSRMGLFTPSDVGSPKVQVAAKRLRGINPSMHVDAREDFFDQAVGLAEIRDAQLIISCLDSRSARFRLCGRCQLVQAPYIDGGTHPWGGEVRPYVNQDHAAACYACSLSVHERGVVDVPWSCLDKNDATPVAAAIPSTAIIGSWMGTLAVRYLMKLSIPSETLVVDVTRGTTYLVNQERDLQCPLHKPLEKAEQVAITHKDTIAALLALLPIGAIPRSWNEIQYGLDCTNPRCGYTLEMWTKTPKITPCPRCGSDMYPMTTIELVNAPPSMRLVELGVAPREILSVYTDTGSRLIELAG